MSFFGLFRRSSKSPTPEEADEASRMDERRRASEKELADARGEFRNKVQTIQSHSRRLQIMAGALALREGYDAKDDE